MIKLIVAAAVTFLLGATGAKAQFFQGCGVKLGAAAANQAWQHPANLSWDYRWGIVAGGFFEFLDQPFLSIILEGDYVQKGLSSRTLVTSEEQPLGWGEYITQKPRVDYLSIQILGKFRLSNLALRPYVLAGPRLDVLISKRPDGFEAVFNDFRSNDLGATLGFGVEWAELLPHAGVLLECTFHPDLQAAYDNGIVTVKNRSFNFLLGVLLRP